MLDPARDGDLTRRGGAESGDLRNCPHGGGASSSPKLQTPAWIWSPVRSVSRSMRPVPPEGRSVNRPGSGTCGEMVPGLLLCWRQWMRCAKAAVHGLFVIGHRA